MELVTFENTHREGPEELKLRRYTSGAVACTVIDGYPADPDNDAENAAVVCVIWLTHGCGIIVDWHDTAYQKNEAVEELIEQSIRDMKKIYAEDVEITKFWNSRPLTKNGNDLRASIANIIAYRLKHNATNEQISERVTLLLEANEDILPCPVPEFKTKYLTPGFWPKII